MNIINAILTTIAGVCFAPFAALPAWVALVFWSAVLGVLMAIGFRFTSPQRKLKIVVDRIRANMLGMKLFKDDLGVTFRVQVQLFKSIAMRLLYSLPPMLVMIIPFVLILTQFAVWYEKQPFEPGDAIVVELRLSPRVWNQSENLTLHAPEGVRVEARVRDESAHEVTWRISPQISEPFTVSWNIGGETIEKKIAVAKSRDRLVPVSPLRPGTGFVDRLLYPLERAFDADSPVRAIEVRHPARSTEIFGIDVPWWLTFLIVSMLCAFLSKPFTKVQF